MHGESKANSVVVLRVNSAGSVPLCESPDLNQQGFYSNGFAELASQLRTEGGMIDIATTHHETDALPEQAFA